MREERIPFKTHTSFSNEKGRRRIEESPYLWYSMEAYEQAPLLWSSGAISYVTVRIYIKYCRVSVLVTL